MLAAAVAAIAQWLLIAPALLVFWSIVVRKSWRFDLIDAAIAGALTILFVKVGGSLYAHPRPFLIDHRPPLVAHAPDNAFPSDHLAACGLAFVYLWPRKRLYAVLALLSAALIGAARVLAGLHWPLDIAAGFLIGGAAAAMAHVAVRSRVTA